MCSQDRRRVSYFKLFDDSLFMTHKSWAITISILWCIILNLYETLLSLVLIGWRDKFLYFQKAKILWFISYEPGLSLMQHDLLTLENELLCFRLTVKQAVILIIYSLKKTIFILEWCFNRLRWKVSQWKSVTVRVQTNC